jgi:hypothetical protein
MSLRVVLEVAERRAFASALDWPGWSRGAKTPDEALQALLDYADRYARVARRAKVAFSPPATLRGMEVVERLGGGGGTEFGVPSEPAAAEDDPLTARDLKRLVGLLEAAWATFDAVADRGKGVELRLGPRGGGRQVPKIVDHVREAEAAYVHQLGTKVAERGMAELRRDFVETLIARAEARDLARPNKVKRPWGPRYAARRSAWHALDHAWEIEDRSPG